MAHIHWSNQDGFSLYSYAGERKYLSKSERQKFLKALCVLDDEKERSFVELLFWTGARPSEALALSAAQVDVDESVVVFCSLKKRGRNKGRKFRPVPVPPRFMDRLARIHDLKALQAEAGRGQHMRLWTFCRTTAWKRIKTVCAAAGLEGIKATGRGLRHGFGVGGATANVEPSQLQDMLGHEDYETTAIYLKALGPEQRAIAERMWEGFEVP